MDKSFVRPELIVETDWLAHHLGDPDVRVIDATTHLMPATGKPYDIVSGRADFEKAHIPGAGFIDIDEDISDASQHPLHFMLPSNEHFAAAMRAQGIGESTLVVCYSSANHWWATRLWWMLRVYGHDRAAVLNGGFQKWQREQWPIESGPQRAATPATSFKAHKRSEMVAAKADVLAAIGAGDTCTLNALRPEQHAGTGGSVYGRPGHITGSVNVAALNMVDADNTFKPAAELAELMRPALDKPHVITYCGGGIAATSTTLILTMLGHDSVRVYDASLTEWAPDATLPMQTGP